MKRILLGLAFATLMAAAAPSARAYTRVSVGFGYGNPYCWYGSAYAYPVVEEANHPPYRFYRRYRPHYRAYFRYRPHARIMVRSCY